MMKGKGTPSSLFGKEEDQGKSLLVMGLNGQQVE
jgi:hypothetical protein